MLNIGSRGNHNKNIRNCGIRHTSKNGKVISYLKEITASIVNYCCDEKRSLNSHIKCCRLDVCDHIMKLLNFTFFMVVCDDVKNQ